MPDELVWISLDVTDHNDDQVMGVVTSHNIKDAEAETARLVAAAKELAAMRLEFNNSGTISVKQWFRNPEVESPSNNMWTETVFSMTLEAQA